MLTLVNENTYIYNGSVKYDADDDNYTEIVFTNYAPLSNTRGNSTESTNELDSLYVSEIWLPRH